MKSKSGNKFEKLKFTSQSIDIDELRAKVLSNLDYFNAHNSPDSLQISTILQSLNVNLDKISKISKFLENLAIDNDFDSKSSGNGYWSFIYCFNAAARETVKICRQLMKNRGKILFKPKSYSKDLELWNEIFGSFIEICEVLLTRHESKADKKCLYTVDNNWDTLNRVASTINQRAFYGNAAGFQTCGSNLKFIIKILVTSLVSYSKIHYSDKHKSIRLLDFSLSTGKYFLKPKRRSHKYLATTHKGDVDFCKNYWFMCEAAALQAVPNALSEKVEVNKIFKIPPIPLEIFSEKYKKFINVPVPHSHISTSPIACRLMSAKRHIGMMGKKTESKSMPKSKFLVFHVHGGGWAAQTSKSHEIYLKQWAVKLNCPILSIDYSLSPEAPFPRAIEEVYYAYCWSLMNLDYLGTTGERIVFAGDSAGANLNSGVLVKCIEEGIRIPDGILNIYGIFNVGFVVAPSGFLTLIDPMLPFGLTSKLMKAYGMDKQKTDSNGNFITDSSEIEHSTRDNTNFNFTFHKSHFLSPYEASDDILRQFPPTKFLTTILDPLLDDSIEFGKKLRSLDVDTNLDVLGGLFHGFLYFTKISKECRNASLMCAERIKELLAGESNNKT